MIRSLGYHNRSGDQVVIALLDHFDIDGCSDLIRVVTNVNEGGY